MTSRDYFNQAYSLDQRINSEIEQVSRLHELATKATSTLSDMPISSTRNTQRMENIIVKIVDLENEINDEIDRLVDLKADIMRIIKNVDDVEEQTLLELRYLCFKSWKEIADDMGYSTQHIYRLHANAIERLTVSSEDFNSHNS